MCRADAGHPDRVNIAIFVGAHRLERVIRSCILRLVSQTIFGSAMPSRNNREGNVANAYVKTAVTTPLYHDMTRNALSCITFTLKHCHDLLYKRALSSRPIMVIP